MHIQRAVAPARICRSGAWIGRLSTHSPGNLHTFSEILAPARPTGSESLRSACRNFPLQQSVFQLSHGEVWHREYARSAPPRPARSVLGCSAGPAKGLVAVSYWGLVAMVSSALKFAGTASVGLRRITSRSALACYGGLSSHRTQQK